MNERTIYVMDCLNLLNVTYSVSNKGKEIQFDSKLNFGKIKVYPTTGSWLFFPAQRDECVSNKMEPHAGDKAVENNIRRMMETHVNRRF